MQRADLASAIKDLIDSINGGNVPEAMDYFPDEAVLRVEPALPGSPMGTFRGKEMIQSWIEDLLNEHLSIDARNVKVAGNEVTWDSTISADRFSQLGVDPVQAKGRATVDDSLIKSLTFTYTPETVKKVQAAAAAQVQPR